MGTRHLIAVQIDGEYKIAQYGQWDGYPEGQGVDILAFLRKISDEASLNQFKSAVWNCRWATDREIAAADKVLAARREELEAIASAESRGGAWEESGGLLRRLYPQYSRDTGAKILSHVAEVGGCALQNEIAFAQDSLMCEFAYVIDLDKDAFEVFFGFNTQDNGEDQRFPGVAKKPFEECNRSYGPVRFVKSYPLNNLPTKEQFLADLKPDDDDDA